MKSRLNQKILGHIERTIDAILECSCQSQDATEAHIRRLNRLIGDLSEVVELLMPLLSQDSEHKLPSANRLLADMFKNCYTKLSRIQRDAERLAAEEVIAEIVEQDFSKDIHTLASSLNPSHQAVDEKLRQLGILGRDLFHRIGQPEPHTDTPNLIKAADKEMVALEPTTAAPSVYTRKADTSDYDSVVVIDADQFLSSLCRKLTEIDNDLAANALNCHAVKHCVCLGSPEDRVCPIRESIQSGRAFQSEKCQETQDGLIRELEVSLFPISHEGRVNKIVRVARDVTQTNRNKREVHQLAYFDALTGLPNRSLLEDRLKQALAQAQRRDQRLAVLYMDLDNFKQINDTFGHHNGDQVLIEAAQRLSESLRESDSIARFGGDEFVVFLPDISDDQEMVSVISKVLRSLSRPFTLRNALATVGASIGVAVFPEDGMTPQTLLNHADLAMYAAKKAGKNQFHFFSEDMHQMVQQRAQLEADLASASQNGEFFLTYQPQFDVRSGKIVGVEALLRWRTVDGSILKPDDFLKVANETGLILPIGEWVLQTACRQLMFWHRKGLGHLSMAINVSATQMLDSRFRDQVELNLSQTRIDPTSLTLELSESCFNEPNPTLIRNLNACKEMGVHLAIDDFGTGSFALPNLISLPFDRLKIDRSVMADIMSEPRSAALVESILVMAQRLGIIALAEGVESDEQLAFLTIKGCREMQGYYFGKPMKPIEISCLLDQAQTGHI